MILYLFIQTKYSRNTWRPHCKLYNERKRKIVKKIKDELNKENDDRGKLKIKQAKDYGETKEYCKKETSSK